MSLPHPLRFPIVTFDNTRMAAGPRMVIKGLLPREALVTGWGPPKCGKSFLFFDMTMHVALGWDYRGRRVEQGPVLYCALEGVAGFAARVEAFRMHRMAEAAEPPPFYLMTRPLSLALDVEDLLRDVLAQLPEGVRPAVVVLDTLNRCFVGSENDDECMNRFIKAADAIRTRFACTVIVIHHSGVAGDRPRGHTSLGGAVDAQLAVRKSADGTITMTTEWMKDGPEGDVIASRLRSVEVGEDEDGDAITSCIVEPIEEGSPQSGHPSPRKLSDKQILAMRALTETVLSHGKPPPPAWGLPAGIIAVTLEDWRTELRARGVIPHDDKNPTTTHQRIKTQLAARNLIGERDGLAWSTHA